MKLTNGEAHPKHDTYFMLALESRFKNDVPHFGVFTMEFLHDLHDDVLIKRGYMFSLTQDVKKMMGENDKKITLQSTTAITSLQSESHSPHPKTASSIENNDKPINYNPMDINFEAIFEVALTYADDPEEMKEFCMREQRKAEKEHEYIDKSFYKGLLKVVADKKERAKYQPKPGPTPTQIGSFFIAGGGGSGYDYKSIELLEQIINELRDEGEALIDLDLQSATNVNTADVSKTPSKNDKKMSPQTRALMHRLSSLEEVDYFKPSREDALTSFSPNESPQKEVKEFYEKEQKESEEKPTIDVETLGKYFHPEFKGRGNNSPDHFSQLIKDIKLLDTQKEIGQVALMIYESKNVNSQMPNVFSSWYKVFCECFGGKVTYRKSQLRNPKESIKIIFRYIEPKI
ncbi:MAG: hypothetical protein GX921_06290 [Bacteroidales bacterium]|nr:hypothetical protein [Bacteroidales bacterium]